MGFKKISAYYDKKITEDELKKAGFTIDKEDPEKVALINLDKFSNSFMAKHRLVYHRSGMFYKYVNGVYVLVDDNLFSRILKSYLNKYAQYLWSKPLDSTIRNEYAVHSKRVEDFDVDKNILNLKSGLFNLDTYEQEPHSPEHNSSIQLPVNYNLDAECPQFMKFLDDTFGDDAVIDLVAQMIGYMLTAETKAEKAFLFLGSGSNGKSTLIKVITALIGKANICTVPLSDLGNSFTRLSLMGKLVCACTENEKDGAGSGSKFQTGMFKAIISGDDIDVEIKNGARFSITPTVKFMFAFNTLPMTRDTTHGFFRKIIIIPFNRVIDEDMKNPQLPNELKNELDGIFNFALSGLKKLRQNNYKFPTPEAVEKELSKYKSAINPLLEYLSDNIEVSANDRVLNKDLYQDYVAWADGDDLLKEGREFMGRFKLALDNAGVKYRGSKTNGNNCLIGIKLKENINATDNGEKLYSI